MKYTIMVNTGSRMANLETYETTATTDAMLAEKSRKLPAGSGDSSLFVAVRVAEILTMFTQDLRNTKLDHPDRPILEQVVQQLAELNFHLVSNHGTMVAMAS